MKSAAIQRPGTQRPMSPTGLGGVVRVVAVRPALWATAIGQLVRLAPTHWWRQRPWSPAPDRRLWAFRMETAYGAPDEVPESADVVAYLEWCRTTAPLVRVGRGGSR